jgi:hypothetical protein
LKLYVVTGHPLGFEFAEIQDKNVGTEFEMDMDPSVERALLDTRAILILAESAEEAPPEKPEAVVEPEKPEAPAPAEPEKPAEPAPKRAVPAGNPGARPSSTLSKAPDDPRKPASADRK